MSDIDKLIRPNISNLKPYSTARDEFKGAADIYLDANENPYPSPYHRYPDPLQTRLKAKIASVKKVNPEQIFIGNGSDEAIDLLIRAFCEPAKDAILITEPTYGMYSVCAGVNNVEVIKTKLTPDFQLDTDVIQSSLTPAVKIIFLCSPNNPSGNLLKKELIIRLLNSFQGIVVVDEAYIDFADDEGFLPLISDYQRLVVLQTLSKAWGLAGLRLGMAFAQQELIQVLNKIKYPYNISTLVQQVVLEQLGREEEKVQQVQEIIQQRQKLAEELSGIPLVEHIYPSDANFLLVRVNNARATYDYLLNESIIVRDRSNVVLCDNCLRITIGTPEENQRLLRTLTLFAQTKAS